MLLAQELLSWASLLPYHPEDHTSSDTDLVSQESALDSGTTASHLRVLGQDCGDVCWPAIDDNYFGPLHDIASKITTEVRDGEYAFADSSVLNQSLVVAFADELASARIRVWLLRVGVACNELSVWSSTTVPRVLLSDADLEIAKREPATVVGRGSHSEDRRLTLTADRREFLQTRLGVLVSKTVPNTGSRAADEDQSFVLSAVSAVYELARLWEVPKSDLQLSHVQCLLGEDRGLDGLAEELLITVLCDDKAINRSADCDGSCEFISYDILFIVSCFCSSTVTLLFLSFCSVRTHLH